MPKFYTPPCRSETGWHGHAAAYALLSEPPPRLQRLLYLVQNDRIVDGGRHGPGLIIRDLLDRATQDFARPRLRQPRDGERQLERCHAAHLFTHECNNFFL